MTLFKVFSAVACLTGLIPSLFHIEFNPPPQLPFVGFGLTQTWSQLTVLCPEKGCVQKKNNILSPVMKCFSTLWSGPRAESSVIQMGSAETSSNW